MKSRLLLWLDALRSSYWFIPTVMALGAIALSFAAIAVDAAIGTDWMEAVPWVSANKPSGARAVLSTIASSMIGVAGVTFSITIASVVYASGMYGPRLLTSFMRDRGNQVTLGTFIATYLYCLLVLRTVRDAQEGGVDTAGLPFVPQVAVLLGLLMALASIAVLIYFIHHIPSSIHVSNVLAAVGRELERSLRTLFPEAIGEAHDGGNEEDVLPDGFLTGAVRVAAPTSGYLQGLDADALMDLATTEALVLRVQHVPGDFVSQGDTLLLAWPPGAVTDDVRAQARRAFASGIQRTPLQDTRFLINELVEIAARALSPGVNDPFTAMTAIDWLGSALKTLARAEIPSGLRFDDAGGLRVVVQPLSFASLVHALFGQLRPYAAGDANAACHLFHTLAEAVPRLMSDDRRAVVRAEADALRAGAERMLTHPADLDAVQRAHHLVVSLLAGRVDFEAHVVAATANPA